MKTKNLKKILTLAVSFLYVLATLITGGLFFATSAQAATQVLNAIQGYGAIESGKYSYIYFGEYPQRRVLEVTNGTGDGKTGWDTFPNYCPDSVAVENTIKGYIAELNEQYYNKYLPAVGSGEIYDAVSTHFATNSISFGSYDWENSTIYSFYPQQNFETKNLYFDYTTGYYTLKTNVVYPNSATNKTPGAIAYSAGTKFHTYNHTVDSANKDYGYIENNSTELVRQSNYNDNTLVTSTEGYAKLSEGQVTYLLDIDGDGVGETSYEITENGQTYLYIVEPIKWKVLSYSGNSVFIVSENILDTVRFNLFREYGNEWAYSSIRSWLNGVDVSGFYDDSLRTIVSSNRNFFSRAFSTELQNAIKETTIEQTSKQSFYANAWHYYTEEAAAASGKTKEDRPTTKDKVFVLSNEELANASYGFKETVTESDTARRVNSSDYAVATGTEDYSLRTIVGKSSFSQNRKSGQYGGASWTRNNVAADGDAYSYRAHYMNMQGSRDSSTCLTSMGVRPAMNVDISKIDVASISGNTAGGWLETDGGVPNENGTIDSPIKLDYASQMADGTKVNTSAVYSMGEKTYASMPGELVAGTDAETVAQTKSGSWQVESAEKIESGTNAGKYRHIIKVNYNDQVAGSYLVARLVNTSNNQNVAMAPITSVLVNNSTPDNNTSTYFVSGTTYFEFVGANDKPTYKVIVYACQNGSLQTAGIYPHIDGNLNDADVSSFLQNYTDNGNAYDYVYFGEYPKKSMAEKITSTSATDGYNGNTTYGTFTARSVSMTNTLLKRIEELNNKYYNTYLPANPENSNYKYLVKKNGGTYPYATKAYDWLDTASYNSQGIHPNNSNLTVEEFYPLEDFSTEYFFFDYETGYYTFIGNTFWTSAYPCYTGTKFHVYNNVVDVYQKYGYYYNSKGEIGSYSGHLDDKPVISTYKYIGNSTYLADFGDGQGERTINYTLPGATYLFVVEPIKWRVLDVNGSNITVVSDDLLDVAKHAHYTSYGNEWQYSNIRKWLNGLDESVSYDQGATHKYIGSDRSFIDMAFSKDLQNAIVEKENSQDFDKSFYLNKWNCYTEDTAIYEGYTVDDVQSRPTTLDKVWLLSTTDSFGAKAYKGFASGASNIVYNTDYTIATGNHDTALLTGAWQYNTRATGGNGADWLLRSASANRYNYSGVSLGGITYSYDAGYTAGIRPALTLDLSKLNVGGVAAGGSLTNGTDASPIDANKSGLSGKSEFSIFSVNASAEKATTSGSWQAVSVANSATAGYYTHKIKVDFAGLYSDYSNQVLNAKVSDKNGVDVAFATIASAKNGVSGTTYFTFDAPTNKTSDYIIEIYAANNGVMTSANIYQKDADGTIGAHGTIWLDPVLGNDNNTGLLEAYPIATIERAMQIAGDNAVIMLKNTIYITKDTTISFNGENVTIKRYYFGLDDYFSGNMFEVGVWDSSLTDEQNNANKVNLTINNVTINGSNQTLVDKGFVSGVAFRVYNGNIVVNEGSTFTNNMGKQPGGAYKGALFYIENSNITINGGYFTKNVAAYGSGTGSNGGVIYATGKSSVIINGGEFISNSAYVGGTIYASGIDAFEMHGGYIQGGATETATINVYNVKNVVVRNAQFVSCAGGAYYRYPLYLNNCENVEIQNCLFKDNKAQNTGGAIGLNKVVSAKIYDTDFINNESKTGSAGAIYAVDSNVEIYNCNFDTNKSVNSGAAIYVKGNSANTSAYSFRVLNSKFNKNKCNSTNGSHGGSICAAYLNVAVDNCEFTGNNCNYNGGAIYVDTSVVTITACRFVSNISLHNGGAIGSAGYEASLKVENCVFDQNKVTQGNGTGGAIIASNKTIDIYNSKFTKNTCGGNATGGGAIRCDGGKNVNIENSDFVENSSKGNGGAVCTSASETNIVKNCNFINNQGGYSSGGAIYCNKTLFVDGGLFKGNRAPRTGGAISGTYTLSTFNNEGYKTASNHFYHGGDTPQATIKNAIFEGNYVTDTRVSVGGAICLSGNSKPDSIDNCIFKNNSALVGGAVIASAYHNNAINSSVTITNSVFEGNTANGSLEYVTDSGLDKPVYNVAGGGAVAMLGKSLRVDKCDFVNNSATAGTGGAISTAITTSSVNIYDSNFVDNSATSNGGAVYIKTSDQNLENIISNCYFEGNKGSVGGALATAGYMTIDNCTFIGNSSSTHDGALSAGMSNTIRNVVFRYNKSNNLAGALSVAAYSVIDGIVAEYNTAKNGGALYIGNSITLKNYTIRYNNATSSGGGIYSPGTISYGIGTVLDNVVGAEFDENGNLKVDAEGKLVGGIESNLCVTTNATKIRFLDNTDYSNTKIGVNFEKDLSAGDYLLTYNNFGKDLRFVFEIDDIMLIDGNQYELYLTKPDNYCIYVKLVNKAGIINYTASDYHGVYDNEYHGIEVNVFGLDNYTIKYGLTEGTYNLTEAPLFKDATLKDGSTTEVEAKTVYFKITASGKTAVEDSRTVKIEQIKTDWKRNNATLSIYLGHTVTRDFDLREYISGLYSVDSFGNNIQGKYYFSNLSGDSFTFNANNLSQLGSSNTVYMNFKPDNPNYAVWGTLTKNIGINILCEYDNLWYKDGAFYPEDPNTTWAGDGKKLSDSASTYPYKVVDGQNGADLNTMINFIKDGGKLTLLSTYNVASGKTITVNVNKDLTINRTENASAYHSFKVEQTGKLIFNVNKGVMFEISGSNHAANSLISIIYNKGTFEINGYNNVSIKKNYCSLATAGETKNLGGAVYNEGILTLDGVKFSILSAQVGSAIYNVGTATVKNCKFSDFGAKISGSGIYSSGSLYIYGSTFSGLYLTSDSQGGGAIYVANNSTIEMYDSVVSKNYSYLHTKPNEAQTSNLGGGLYIAEGVNAYLEDCEITGNSAYAGGGIYAKGSASNKTTLTLVNTKVDNNSLVNNATVGYGNGGGIYAGSYVDLTITGGSISGNKAYNYDENTPANSWTFAWNHGYGGGIYISTESVLNVDGGTQIDGNHAVRGGAICLGASVVANLNRCTISNNFARYYHSSYAEPQGLGAAVYSTNSTLNLNTGTVISSNTSLQGIVCAENGSTLNIDGASIKNNNVLKECLIYVSGAAVTGNLYSGIIANNNNPTSASVIGVINATFNMYGGIVTNNTSNRVVRVMQEAKFNMYGGEISYNNSPGQAGSGTTIYLQDKATMLLDGGDVLYNAPSQIYGLGNNIYLAGTQTKLTIQSGRVLSAFREGPYSAKNSDIYISGGEGNTNTQLCLYGGEVDSIYINNKVSNDVSATTGPIKIQGKVIINNRLFFSAWHGNTDNEGVSLEAVGYLLPGSKVNIQLLRRRNEDEENNMTARYFYLVRSWTLAAENIEFDESKIKESIGYITVYNRDGLKTRIFGNFTKLADGRPYIYYNSYKSGNLYKDNIYFNPTGGSDSNDGSTEAKAIKTWDAVVAKAQELKVNNVYLTSTWTLANGNNINGQGLTLVRNVGAVAINVPSGVSATISNITIDGGSSGIKFSLITNYGSLTITNATLQNARYHDSTNSKGGAIYNEGVLTLTNTNFFGNESSSKGGAIYSAGGTTTTIDNCRFENNVATTNGGAIYVKAEKADGSKVESTLTITNTSFFNNRVTNAETSYGGAICAIGMLNGDMIVPVRASINGCEFNSNYSALNAGAIYAEETDIKILNNKFTSNSAVKQGGAIRVVRSDCEIDNCYAENNALTNSDNGIFIYIYNMATEKLDGHLPKFVYKNTIVASSKAYSERAKAVDYIASHYDLEILNISYLHNGNNSLLERVMQINAYNVNISGTEYQATRKIDNIYFERNFVTKYALMFEGQYCDATNIRAYNNNSLDGLIYFSTRNYLNLSDFDFRNNYSSNNNCRELDIYCSGFTTSTGDFNISNIKSKNMNFTYAIRILYSAKINLVIDNVDIAEHKKGYGLCLTSGSGNKETGTNATISNVRIDGSKNTVNGNVDIGRLQNVTINNLYITGNGTNKGLLLGNFTTATINNAFISNCKASNNGGAVYAITYTNLTLNNCYFTNNTASASGGAIYGGGTFNNCYFIGNTATHGGAVRTTLNSVFNGCYFEGNSLSSASTADGVVSGGGVISSTSHSSILTINSCMFVDNSTLQYGLINLRGTLTLTDCTFDNNKTSEKLLNSYDGSVKIFNCLFENNNTNGTMIANQFGLVLLKNTIFKQNKVNVLIDNGLEGAVRENLIENCVFEENTSLAEMFIFAHIYNRSYKMTLKDNIFVRNKSNSAMFKYRNSQFISPLEFYNNRIIANEFTNLIEGKHILMKGGVIANNTTRSTYGFFYVTESLDVHNIEFYGNINAGGRTSISTYTPLISVHGEDWRFNFSGCNFYDNVSINAKEPIYGLFRVIGELVLDGCRISNNNYWNADANAYLQNSIFVDTGYAYIRNCVISSKNSAGYNAGPNGVVYISDKAEPCVMVGCEVENGAFGTGSAIVNKGTLSVVDMYAHGNTADNGAIISNYGILNISGNNTNFVGNMATQKGGAIYNNANGRITINIGESAGVFANNKANYGGAIYNDMGAILVVANGTFKANIAEANADGSISGNGGAIYNLGTLTINDALFTENVAQNGGGLYNLGNTTINNGVFNKNYTTVGGGAIYNATETLEEYSNTTFVGEIIVNYVDVQLNTNLSTENTVYGLAIYNGGNLTVKDGYFSANAVSVYAANVHGGSIYSANGGITNVFGGLFNHSETGNNGYGGSFYFGDGSYNYVSNVEFDILGSYDIYSNSDNVIIKNCYFNSIIQNNYSNISINKKIEFYDCEFKVSYGGAGGGAVISGAYIVDGCRFYGGTIPSTLIGPAKDGTIKNCVFEDITILQEHGGIIGGAYSGNVVIDNCHFKNINSKFVLNLSGFCCDYSILNSTFTNCKTLKAVLHMDNAEYVNIANISILNNTGTAIDAIQTHGSALLRLSFYGNNLIKNNKAIDFAGIKFEMLESNNIPTLSIGNGGKLIVEDNFLCDANGNYVDKNGNITTDPSMYVQSNISIPHKTTKKGYLIGGLAEGSRVGINVYLTESGASLYNEFIAISPKEADKPITTSDFECFFYDNNEYGLALRDGNIVLVKPSEISGDKVYVSDKIYLVDGEYKGFDKADFEVYKNSVKVNDFSVLFAENEADANAGLYSAVSPKYANLGEYTIWYKIVDNAGADLALAGGIEKGSVKLSFVKHLLTVVEDPIARLSKGETLANVTFVGGKVMSNGLEVAGTWAFEEIDTIPTDNITKYKANFVAAASNIYANSVSTSVAVEFLFDGVDYKVVSGINEDKAGFFVSDKFTGISLLSEIVPLVANNGVVNIHTTYIFTQDETVMTNNAVRIMRNSALGTNNIFEISGETDISVVIGGGVGKIVFDGRSNNYTQKIFVNNSTLTLGANVEVYNYIQQANKGALIVNNGILNLNGANFRNNLTYINTEENGKGGLIYNANTGIVNISSGNFVKNIAQHSGADPILGGGVIYNDGGSVVITGGTFTNNSATGENGCGGVIYNNAGTVDINGGVFNKNSAKYGGVVYNKGGKVVFGGGTMLYNTAGGEGAVVYNDESDANSNNWGDIVYNGSEMLKNSILGNGKIESVAMVNGVNWWAIAGSILSVVLVGVLAGVLLHKNLRGKRN